MQKIKYSVLLRFTHKSLIHVKTTKIIHIYELKCCLFILKPSCTVWHKGKHKCPGYELHLFWILSWIPSYYIILYWNESYLKMMFTSHGNSNQLLTCLCYIILSELFLFPLSGILTLQYFKSRYFLISDYVHPFIPIMGSIQRHFRFFCFAFTID